MTANPAPIDGLEGWTHLPLDSVVSTNEVCTEIARSRPAVPVWVTATQQTGGRGRRGRAWMSPPGNLHASLLLPDPSPAPKLATLPFVAALAVHGAIRQVSEKLKGRLSIKWPNDVLLDGAKVSGILLESVALPSGKTAAIIGCGVNCLHCPGDALYPTTSLAAAGIDIEPAALFQSLAICMARELDIWNRGEGFSQIRQRWIERACGIGGPVVARLADREIAGIFEGLDPEGFLILKRADGAREKISSADIFFGTTGQNRA